MGVIDHEFIRRPTVARRSAKTIDPITDLSSIFKMPDDLPKPWDAEKLFGRTALLELEIGTGKGLFITRAAEQYPMHNFLGIEISVKYARFAAARLIRQNRTNAAIVCGDAALVLQEKIPNDTLAAVHVYFPDPWWKRAHRKRRILRTEVLQLIESRLAPGGSLHFWTDVEEYFTSTLTLLAKTTALQGPLDVLEREAEDDMDYRTHFERRTRLHGEKVYRAEFRK
jgi:tRNA (guanine-N7-)-methyltransferase